MSLLDKVLKLAQELDDKGLPVEADTLDEFASNITSSESPNASDIDRLDTETYMEMFRELFLYNNTEAGMEPTAAASAAVKAVNKL